MCNRWHNSVQQACAHIKKTHTHIPNKQVYTHPLGIYIAHVWHTMFSVSLYMQTVCPPLGTTSCACPLSSTSPHTRITHLKTRAPHTVVGQALVQWLSNMGYGKVRATVHCHDKHIDISFLDKQRIELESLNTIFTIPTTRSSYRLVSEAH